MVVVDLKNNGTIVIDTLKTLKCKLLYKLLLITSVRGLMSCLYNIYLELSSTFNNNLIVFLYSVSLSFEQF